MRPDRLVFSLKGAAAVAANAGTALALLLACAQNARAQTAAAATTRTTVAGACKTTLPPGVKPDAVAAPGDVVGIRVNASGADGKPLQRKRLFLLTRSLSGAQGIDFSSAPRREEFLKGASAELRAWLDAHDCDTLYCPSYEAEYAAAVKTVPEFRRAFDEGMRRYKSERLALEWITVNFPLKNVRTEYYKRKRVWLENLARQAGSVASVMTDEKGVALFTNLKPGTYYVSNLAPLEQGGLLWDCSVTTPPSQSRLLYSVTVELSAPKPAAAPK